MNSNFFKACLGISLVFISLSLFVYSLTANAATTTPAKTVSSKPSKIGKYMMNISTAVDEKYLYRTILVWDTETGKSRVYYENRKDGNFSQLWGQLPESPLGSDADSSATY